MTKSPQPHVAHLLRIGWVQWPSKDGPRWSTTNAEWAPRYSTEEAMAFRSVMEAWVRERFGRNVEAL